MAMDKYNYLFQAALNLPNSTASHQILKSFYLSKSKHLIRADKKVVEEKFGPTQNCSKCNRLWLDGGCTVVFKPRQSVKNKNLRKYRRFVLRYYSTSQKRGRYTYLANHLAKKVCRKIIYTCKLCNTKQVFYARTGKTKDTMKSKKIAHKAKLTQLEEPIVSKKNKKRKKKEFAGLKKSVMLTVQKTKKGPTTTIVTKYNKQQQPKQPVIRKSAKASQNSILKLAEFLQNSKLKKENTNKLDRFLR